MSRTLGAPAGRDEHRRGQKLRPKLVLAGRREGVVQLTSATPMQQTLTRLQGRGLRWILVTNNSAQLHTWHGTGHSPILPHLTSWSGNYHYIYLAEKVNETQRGQVWLARSHAAHRGESRDLNAGTFGSTVQSLNCYPVPPWWWRVRVAPRGRKGEGQGGGWVVCIFLEQTSGHLPEQLSPCPAARPARPSRGSCSSHHGSHAATARPHRPWIIEGSVWMHQWQAQVTDGLLTLRTRLSLLYPHSLPQLPPSSLLILSLADPLWPC